MWLPSGIINKRVNCDYVIITSFLQKICWRICAMLEEGRHRKLAKVKMAVFVALCAALLLTVPTTASSVTGK